MSYKDYRSFRQEAKLTVFDVPVTVEYFYYPGIPETEFEPPCEEEIEIQSIVVDEFDIYHLIGSKAMSKLYEELYKIIDKQKEEIDE